MMYQSSTAMARGAIGCIIAAAVAVAVIAAGATVASAQVVPNESWRRAGMAPPRADGVPPAEDTSAATDEGAVAPPADVTPAADAAPPAVTVPATRRGGTGVRGTVVDAATGDPVIDARVEVVRGATGSAVTGPDGAFWLALPAGEYTLRVTADFYRWRRVRRVTVADGAARLTVTLEPDPAAVEIVVVEGRPDARTETAGLQERRRATTVQDAVSAQEISRTADSSAGDAVKRVVSATVVGGRYVFIRGLGGRYSTALLNGVVLPSPDPDAAAVPLDLFPASLLANLTVVKSYTPDLPGSFSGGALKIETNSYPSELEVKLKLSGAFDSEASMRDRPSYPAGDYHWLGFDSGHRALPSSVPDHRPLRVGEPGIDAATAERIAEDFPIIWEQGERSALPNFGLGGHVGDTVPVGPGKLGYVANVSYGRKEGLQHIRTTSVRLSEGELETRQTMDSRIGTAGVTWGALANAGYELGEDHRLLLFSLYTRSADDRAQTVQGFSESDNQHIEARRLQFVARALSFSQLQGHHRFARMGALSVDWQANLALTTRDEPDTRDIQFDQLDDGRLRFQNGPGSGERFFSDLDDTSGGGGVDLSLPVGPVTLRAGGLAQASAREFGARRFRFNLIGRDPAVAFLGPEEMMSPEHIGPDVRIEERTLQTDAYDASQRLTAAYAMSEAAPFDRLRLAGGVRYERMRQELTPGSPFAIEDTPAEGLDRTDEHWLWAATAVAAVTPAMNVRASYGSTLARPQLRELAPFLYFDFARRRAVSGNPALMDTRIDNADLRWEWFWGERELVAASLFQKWFRDPIEQVIVNVAQGDVSYANAEGATARGVELEARATLARVSRALAGFRASANLTLIDSQIDLGDEAGPQTSRSRPLQGQSPYVVNVDVGWEGERTSLSLLYNVFGRRIAEVGIEGLPDVYEQPFHRVDATASQALGEGFRLKLTGTNLLARRSRTEQGGILVHEVDPGIAVAASLEWSR
jgi:outer membrane receptor protein involved in Fe transport